MSSRQEEKAARKAEREAAEAQAARSAARKGRLQLALGAVVAVAAIALAVVLFSSSGGSKDGANAKSLKASGSLPAPKQTNLEAAAKTAGCALKAFPTEGREHSDDPKKWIYKTNPPTSGTHAFPPAAEDGLYDPGSEPLVGKTVHALEHGRIDLQYKTGTPKATVDKLETLGSEKLTFGTEGYHILVFQNQTKMPAAVAVTAWTRSLTCPEMNDAVYDAVRDFRATYTDKGPEIIP